MVILASTAGDATGQFLETFDRASLEGWTYFTGDGLAEMDFRQKDGLASIYVDASRDRDNIWWALVKREVSGNLDLARLARPGNELRVEARIRVSNAPRRVNLHLNTQKTVDFHSHLMEYDIPDTLDWHVISMTTRGFEAHPGDTVNAQMALMDWGTGRYRVDIAYFRVDVVNVTDAGPDLGEPLRYHPPIPPVDQFGEQIAVLHDAVLHLDYPALRFKDWRLRDVGGEAPVLAVGASQIAILRWDLSAYSGHEVVGAGVLELTTRSMQWADAGVEEYGQIRVTEILGGDPAWDESNVTVLSFTGKPSGEPSGEQETRTSVLDEVLNPQMIIDVAVTAEPGGRTLATISRPVLQRMIDGRTLGLALRPLGPIHATLYAHEEASGVSGPRLHFNVRAPGSSKR